MRERLHFEICLKPEPAGFPPDVRALSAAERRDVVEACG